MSDRQYGVDLDALDQVVKELNQVIKDMSGPRSTAKHATYLKAGSLGEGFKEERELRKSHDVVKTKIEELVEDIEGLIDDFGKKSSSTLGAYQNAEANNKIQLA
ncbi:hypothetical protein H3146_10290 [Streptomyces sp. OF3]|uniref:WXG100 family type VII secretion target n=1 Tax=Streptomyces alkaliterrae TaxID=2213162 RepID=A0A7W3WK39_9ACTN|nr:hypothetical protein [Streptomyces alkaliterrae]MBB1253754.1 hypothetical protein [Streptomyces alkaliterrae]